MADAVYKIKFTMSDGTYKEIEFTAPQGPAGAKGDPGPVYARSFAALSEISTFFNAIYKAGAPAATCTLKIRYTNANNVVFSMRTDEGSSFSLNPGEEAYLLFTKGKSGFGAFTIVDGVVNPAPIQMTGRGISIQFPGIFGYLEVVSNYDLTSLVG